MPGSQLRRRAEMRRDGTNRMPVTVSTRRGRPCRLLRRSSYKDHDVVDDEVVQRGFIEAPVSLLTVPDRGYCGLLSISAPIDYAKRMWCRSTHHSYTCEGETVLPPARGLTTRAAVSSGRWYEREAWRSNGDRGRGDRHPRNWLRLGPRPEACSLRLFVLCGRSPTFPNPWPGRAWSGASPVQPSPSWARVGPSCHPGDPAEWCGGAGPATDDRSGGHPRQPVVGGDGAVADQT